MLISFSEEGLRRLCLEEREGRKRLGAACAKKLRTRLAELDAAISVRDLVAGSPHPLKGDREGQFSVSLAGGKRLVFEPADDPPPLKDDESIDWSEVVAITIVFIGDYHD